MMTVSAIAQQREPLPGTGPIRDSSQQPAANQPARPARGGAASATPSALTQEAAPAREDELLLPDTIIDSNIEMRSRFTHQWKQDDGTLVVVFQGGFRLDAGARRMTSEDAVVWINSGLAEPQNRKYYELTVYLSRSAEVREPGGTITLDDVLLVSNLRTFGQIVKLHDAHAPESYEDSPLYQQAIRDRALIELQRAAPPSATPAVSPTEIARPSEVFSPRTAKRPRTVTYRIPQAEPATTAAGQPVMVARRSGAERVYFSQTGGDTDQVLEIQADNAVIFTAGEGAVGILQETEPGQGRETPKSTTEPPQPPPTLPGEPPPAPETPQPAEGPRSTGEVDLGGQLKERIAAVYLEGDVTLSFGSRFIRADRLYYDFQNSRALILDAVLRADVPQRNIPLYVRADEIRQLSEKEYSADHARVTTSEFYSPHYHVGAERVYVRDTTPRDSGGRATGPVHGQYEMRDATMNVLGMPIAWWPYSKGDFEASETSIKNFRTAYTSHNGFTVQTQWHLFNLLGAAPPPGFDATLRLDYFGKRGPAAGVNVDYERKDYYGLFRSYGIIDDGKDKLGPLADNTPDREERGRILWRHRQFLPNDWQATIETAYVCDPNFLQEWEKNEWFEGKEQETALYLKRQRGEEAVTLLANWRLLDFVTQTEHLPELAYRRIGDVLDPLVFYHESRIGMVRYRPDDRKFFDLDAFEPIRSTDLTFRADAREEAELPLKLGPVNLSPFAMLRGSFWDGAIEHDGGLWRGLGSYGVRGGTMFSRVYEAIENELLDIHGIRHIVKPEFAGWWAHSNTDSSHVYLFDEGIETIDDFYGGMFALRQTWQTKRGPADNRRTVDLLTLNVEAGFFGDVPDRAWSNSVERRRLNGFDRLNRFGRGKSDGSARGRSAVFTRRPEFSNGYANPIRPEDSRTRDYIALDTMYRLSDTTSLLYDFNYDVNDGTFDHHAVSLAVERSPRLAYVFGYRAAADIDMGLVGGGFNYKLSEKHIFAVRDWYDIDRGDNGEIAVSYIRKMPRWYFAVNFEYDDVDDELNISVSLWPEGIPEWTLGSRRFTGVGTSTGIRP